MSVRSVFSRLFRLRDLIVAFPGHTRMQFIQFCRMTFPTLSIGQVHFQFDGNLIVYYIYVQFLKEHYVSRQ